MSGPLEDVNEVAPGLGISAIEVREGRTASVGGFDVLRVLPTKRRRTVGPWCFVDLMHPGDVVEPPPIEIGPHPHIGLATATWMFRGTVLHSDSLGTEQLIRPGELNLMTAGRGIAHAELGIEAPEGIGEGGIVGAQMWLALPDATRGGSSRFEHHAELPAVSSVGPGPGASPGSSTHSLSRAGRRPSGPRPRRELPRCRGHLPRSHVRTRRRPGRTDDQGRGRDRGAGLFGAHPAGFDRLRVEERAGSARFLLLGGEPFGVEIKMWWNFVARTFEEIDRGVAGWAERDDDRFGPVPSGLARVEAPTPPWLRGGS